jgi:hypothetical protein
MVAAWMAASTAMVATPIAVSAATPTTGVPKTEPRMKAAMETWAMNDVTIAISALRSSRTWSMASL